MHRRIPKWIWIVALAGVVVTVGLHFAPQWGHVPDANPWRPAPGRPVLVIAHGGGQGLQPPNTLQAFDYAVSLGCDALEMDLRITRDGVLVTLHDETVDRTSNGAGRVADLTLAEVKALNFGARFKDPSGAQPYKDNPARLGTLEELFTRFPSMPMVVELKDRGTNGVRAAQVLARLIRRFQRVTRTIVASFDDDTLERFREISRGEAFTAGALGETKSFVLETRAWLDGWHPVAFDALQIPVAKQGYRLDFPGLVAAAHRRNLAVHYWTINDPAEMRRLIALGADGIMTDRPDLLRQVLASPGR
jgi:glycerophosphoryl diester phosphodiesterase